MGKQENKMKTFAVATLVATVAAADKKVPPRHPLQRLSKLGRFAGEWCDDNLSAKAATNWNNKFAERYLANDKDGASCKLQPEKQVARAQAWHDKLLAKLAANL